MNAPRVTIVVASYNHARYVRASVTSVLAQTVRNCKVVVIDDGSRDGSREVLRELAAQGGFTLVEQENRGLARLLNRAMDELVEGEYVVFFASDDLCEPDRIERQVAFLDANPDVAMVFGDVWKIDADGRRFGRMVASRARGRLFSRALAGRLSVPPQSTMWRRAALDAVGRFDPSVRSEDIWLLWRVSRNHRIAWLPGVFASYRHHPTQTSRDARLMVAEAQARLAEYAAEPCYRAARRSQARFWFFALSRDYPREALRHLPAAAARPWDLLVLGGIANLLGLGALLGLVRRVRNRVRALLGGRGGSPGPPKA